MLVCTRAFPGCLLVWFGLPVVVAVGMISCAAVQVLLQVYHALVVRPSIGGDTMVFFVAGVCTPVGRLLAVLEHRTLADHPKMDGMPAFGVYRQRMLSLMVLEFAWPVG